MPRQFLPVFLAFLIKTPVWSEPPDQVLDKAIRAHGGEDALNRFPAATWKGKGQIRVRGQTILSSDEGPVRVRGQGTKTRETTVVIGDSSWTITDGKTEAKP
jgi:hypothetical protein